MNQYWQSKDPKLPPHAHKKEGGGGRGERGGGGGRESKKEKRKERKQDYNLIKAGTVAYLGRDDIATLWSKASRDIGLQSREIVKAFTSMVGARAYHPPLNVCKLRRFGELYQSSWVFNKLLDFKVFFAAVLRDIC